MNQTPEAARQTLYPIREVSRLTGVNPITLRAWERRYGLLVPHRTDGGHRLYSLQDIERVRSVTQWIARGVPVSKVAGILDREDVDEAEAPLDDGAFSRYDVWQQRLDQALLQGDPFAAGSALRAADDRGAAGDGPGLCAAATAPSSEWRVGIRVAARQFPARAPGATSRVSGAGARDLAADQPAGA
ncbi:MerR family transcriptional regulator [Halopseudomonas pachastrellae]|nr:MerR family transcriptional regulator [Halopseudomonas pachastrellae]